MRKVDKPLILYGKGKLGKLAAEIFDKLGISYGVMDRSCSCGGCDKALVAVCVGTESFYSITKYLQRLGWRDIVPVWDIVEAYPEIGIHNGWSVGEFTEEDKKNTTYVVSKLDDIASRFHYWSFIEWRKLRDIEVCSPLSIPPLPSTLADIEKRRRVMLWSDRRMPFVSIHAEGKELETLEKNILVFQKRRPKIDVTCYHSRDGLWKIEKFLMDNLCDYDFSFRLHAYMGLGAIMYCIPKERSEV